MPIRTDIRYIQFPMKPGPLDALGIDPGDDGVAAIYRALGRYRAEIAGARRKLGETFDRREMCLMADVMNGTWLVGGWIDLLRAHLMANLQDSQWPEDREGCRHSSGFADKWFGAGKGDARTKALMSKIKRSSGLQIAALGLAIRDFWRDPAADPGEEWWRLPGDEEARAEKE